MQEDNPKKGKRILDKVLMGAIIGGAIGSVLGVSIAPKKGKDTRAEIKNKVSEVVGEKKGFFKRLIKSITTKKANPSLKQIPTEQAENKNE